MNFLPVEYFENIIFLRFSILQKRCFLLVGVLFVLVVFCLGFFLFWLFFLEQGEEGGTYFFLPNSELPSTYSLFWCLDTHFYL